MFHIPFLYQVPKKTADAVAEVPLCPRISRYAAMPGGGTVRGRGEKLSLLRAARAAALRRQLGAGFSVGVGAGVQVHIQRPVMQHVFLVLIQAHTTR